MRAGHGIGLLPRYMSWDEVRQGHLVPVLTDWKPEGLGSTLYVITTPSRHPTMATRALIAFLKEEIGKLPVFNG